jgi:hypothetical protein
VRKARRLALRVASGALLDGGPVRQDGRSGPSPVAGLRVTRQRAVQLEPGLLEVISVSDHLTHKAAVYAGTLADLAEIARTGTVGTFVGSSCFLRFVAAWSVPADYVVFPITYKLQQDPPNRPGRSAKPLCVSSILTRASNPLNDVADPQILAWIVCGKCAASLPLAGSRGCRWFGQCDDGVDVASYIQILMF